ncbi:hypothetical protein [Kineococcus arenarius]|uniref:hypothetical protein n=1 Tax=Kineococcus sp. SYSU DK007 TaxID=3383128 RepID=UPI003D7DFBED
MNTPRRALPVLAASTAAAAVVALTAPAIAATDPAEPPVLTARAEQTVDAFDAHQAVAADERAFYAVDNTSITKHDRASGEPLLQFDGGEGGPLMHLDSAAVVDGRLYAAHSNYPAWPMTSSVEVFDTATMQHVDTHSFGVDRGSLTWLDRHDGSWWAGFANYDRVMEGASEAYGVTANTQVVRMDDRFQVLQSWTLPAEILDRFSPMSNSGGSWGPDGRLWVTGHDLPEAYVLELPEAGSQLHWVATVELPGIEGQGIDWDDQAHEPALWGISRDNSQVLSFDVPWQDVVDTGAPAGTVRGPGDFRVD